MAAGKLLDGNAALGACEFAAQVLGEGCQVQFFARANRPRVAVYSRGLRLGAAAGHSEAYAAADCGFLNAAKVPPVSASSCSSGAGSHNSPWRSRNSQMRP